MYISSSEFFLSALCTLQPDTGPCKASSFRYYWNINTRQCERFLYGGCGGNYNKFLDAKSCANQCGKYLAKYFVFSCIKQNPN